MWLAIPLVLAILLVAWLAYNRTNVPNTGEVVIYRVVIGLHAIRCRLEVAQFKTELRRDTANLRRVMRHELQQDSQSAKRHSR
jgi:hypothetical protein